MTDIETAPGNPAGHAPLRRPGSIRRTSSIETIWPDGQSQPMHMTGRARDLITPRNGTDAVTVAEGEFQIVATQRREIVSIVTSPDIRDVQKLVGARAGDYLRALLAETAAEEKTAGSPLYLLLDDYSGVSLVAPWAWSRWVADWGKRSKRIGKALHAERGKTMEAVCIGLRPGSAAIESDGLPNVSAQNNAAVPSLVNPEDALGWHAFTPQDGVGMRRARRIDLWEDNGLIQMDVGFQDSANLPGGGRIAIHEYAVTAVADPMSLELLSLTVDPRILPYGECVSAASYAQRMVGTPLGELRTRVLDLLPGVLGCTHLNDMLRSLADAPQMLRALKG